MVGALSQLDTSINPALRCILAAQVAGGGATMRARRAAGLAKADRGAAAPRCQPPRRYAGVPRSLSQTNRRML
jgi:hypothetical protein